MSDPAGELYIRVLLKGASEAKKGLGEVDNKLKIFNRTLSATGAFAALAYFKKLAHEAGEFGLSMMALQTRTGIAAETFQRFAHAGEMVGIKSEETMSTLNSLQKQMDKFALTGEGPEWINEVAASVKNFDFSRIRDTVYLFRKLQEYATDPRIDKMRKRVALESFGLSDKMIAALMRGSFNARALGSADFVKGTQLKDLERMGGEWSKFSASFKTATNKFAAVFLSPGVTNFLKTLNEFTHWFSKYLDEKADPFYSELGETFDEWIDAATDKSGIAREKLVRKGAASYVEANKQLSDKELNDMLSSTYVDKLRMRSRKLRENPQYLEARKRLEAEGRVYDNGIDLDVVKGVTHKGSTYIFDKQAKRRGLLQQAAAPVTNKNTTMNSSASDNRRVTVNQTNNFTNASDNPQKIRQATQEGVSSGMGMQQQISQAAMATSYASTGS